MRGSYTLRPEPYTLLPSHTHPPPTPSLGSGCLPWLQFVRIQLIWPQPFQVPQQPRRRRARGQEQQRPRQAVRDEPLHCGLRLAAGRCGLLLSALGCAALIGPEVEAADPDSSSCTHEDPVSQLMRCVRFLIGAVRALRAWLAHELGEVSCCRARGAGGGTICCECIDCCNSTRQRPAELLKACGSKKLQR